MSKDYGLMVKGFCEKFKAIRHTPEVPRFFTDADEFLKIDIADGIMVLFIADGTRFSDENSDNVFELADIECWIMTKVESQDYAGEKAAFDTCHAIAKQFLAKMLESRDTFPGAAGFTERIVELQPKNCRILKAGPLGKDKLMGAVLKVYAGEPAKLYVDTDLWDA